MKKIVYILVLALLINTIFIPNVNAAGGITVSKNSISLVTGKSNSFTIKANNAAGRVDITSSNPNIAEVSESSVFLDNNTQVVNVSAISAGSTTIIVKVKDAATYDEEVLKNTYTINVTVSNPPPETDPEPTPTPTPTPTPAPNPTPTPTPSQQPTPTPNQTPSTTPSQQPTQTPTTTPSSDTSNTKSSNNNIKTLTVNGINATTTDNINYSITVEYQVEKVKINATPEDNKATVSGNGDKKVVIGDNTFNILVAAEDKTVKTYTLKVTRKAGAYNVSDIDNALSTVSSEVTIKVDNEDSIDKNDIDKIQKSGKIVNFTKYKDDSKTIYYSIIVDGNKIKENDEIKTDVTISYDNNDIPKEQVESSEGVLIDCKTNNYPSGSKIKVNLSDKYNDGEEFNVYTYENNKLKLVQKNIKLQKGLLEIDLLNSSKYFVAKINMSDGAVAESNIDFINKYKYFLIGGLLIFIIMIVLIIKKKKKNSPTDNTTAQANVVNPTNTMNMNNASNTTNMVNMNNPNQPTSNPNDSITNLYK